MSENPFAQTELLFIWHFALHAEADLQRLQNLLEVAGKTKTYHDQVEFAHQAEKALRELCQWARGEIERPPGGSSSSPHGADRPGED